MISAGLLTPEVLQLGWLLYGPALLWAVWRAPWLELFSVFRR